MARTPQRTPKELTAAWPTTPSDDRDGEAARRIGLVIRDEVTQRGLRPFAADLGVHHATLLRVASGDVWPSLHLVVALERLLDREVWPDRATLPNAH